MHRRAFVFIVFFALTSATERELVVESDGYANIRLGKTKMSTIKRNNLFAKRTKTLRSVLFREPRICRTFFYERISTKKGITYFFNYEVGVKRPITLSEIMFEVPANVRLHNGIRLGESTLKDVAEIYGPPDYTLEHRVSRGYDKIEFYSDRMIGKDSADQNFIVTAFKIKRH